MKMFDRRVKQIQRDAACRRADAEECGYLREAVAERLVDRLQVRPRNTSSPLVASIDW